MCTIWLLSSYQVISHIPPEQLIESVVTGALCYTMTMFSIINLISFDKISSEMEKSHPDNQGTATVAIAGISASSTSAQELVVRNVLVLTRCPEKWNVGKKIGNER